MEKEAKIIQFKTKEQYLAEIRFRHLSDHLFEHPCSGCVDIDTRFCQNECPSRKI